ncbi:hypothetical protein FDG2_6435 [Candidatus Protofrankia californiensis]|uniref:Uncharacterized protein n=1 Tax=Candidatus Protofrankia californiensis TaxID=1839754 RepID=A0A1C3PGZ3_9ACTN|nr:hypothetical protein FDG2_6435 [Candidatus Protofrankia californiensis]
MGRGRLPSIPSVRRPVPAAAQIRKGPPGSVVLIRLTRPPSCSVLLSGVFPTGPRTRPRMAVVRARPLAGVRQAPAPGRTPGRLRDRRSTPESPRRDSTRSRNVGVTACGPRPRSGARWRQTALATSVRSRAGCPDHPGRPPLREHLQPGSPDRQPRAPAPDPVPLDSRSPGPRRTDSPMSVRGRLPDRRVPAVRRVRPVRVGRFPATGLERAKGGAIMITTRSGVLPGRRPGGPAPTRLPPPPPWTTSMPPIGSPHFPTVKVGPTGEVPVRPTAPIPARMPGRAQLPLVDAPRVCVRP